MSTTPAADATGATAGVSALWARRADPFTAACDAVTDWDAPSPCAGWSARDVLEHVVGTQRDFLAQRGHDLPAPVRDDPAVRWRTHRDAVDALLDDSEVAGSRFDGAFGPTTVGAVLTEFYGFDLVVHRWDLSRSQGALEPLEAEELAMIEASVAAWGEHAYAPGIFAAALEVGPGASEQERVLALTGRRV